MSTATATVTCPRCHSTHTVQLFVDRTKYGFLDCMRSFDALLDTPLRDIAEMERKDLVQQYMRSVGIATARPYKRAVRHPLALLVSGLGCSLALFAGGYLLCRGILWMVGR